MLIMCSILKTKINFNIYNFDQSAILVTKFQECIHNFKLSMKYVGHK